MRGMIALGFGLSGWTTGCGSKCVASAECADGFACDPVSDEAGPDGCLERCSKNDECQAGFECDEDLGLCHEPENLVPTLDQAG